MHEYGLCEGVLDAVRRRASGRPVSKVRVRIGARHAAEADSMTQAFGMISVGTEAEEATLDLVTVPAALRCRDCGATAEVTDMLAVCPKCASDNVEITGGDELVLESLEYRP